MTPTGPRAASIAFASDVAGSDSPVAQAVGSETRDLLGDQSPQAASLACYLAAERTNVQTRVTTQELQQLSMVDSAVRMPACRSGCSYCCRGQVTVLPIEALHIARTLRTKWTDSELGNVAIAIASYLQEVSGLSLSDRVAKVIDCPFLGLAGECRIYAERPIICRAHHSVDAEKCKANLADRSVPIPQAPVFADRLLPVLEGLHQGTLDAGLVSRSLPLVDAVSVFLNPGVEASWLSGSDPFGHIEHEAPPEASATGQAAVI